MISQKNQKNTGKKSKKWFNLNAIKDGFSYSIGGTLWYFILILVSLAFFIPGLILVLQERKKEEINKDENIEEKDKEEINKTKKIIGYILMGLGVVFGLGFGGFFLFSLIAEEF